MDREYLIQTVEISISCSMTTDSSFLGCPITGRHIATRFTQMKCEHHVILNFSCQRLWNSVSRRWCDVHTIEHLPLCLRFWRMDYALKEMAVFSAIGFGLNYVFSSVFPSDLIKGDPRWMYNLGICYQSVLFPYYCFRSWMTKRSLKDWMTLPWSQLDVTYDKLYMGCIFGYWVRCMILSSRSNV